MTAPTQTRSGHPCPVSHPLRLSLSSLEASALSSPQKSPTIFKAPLGSSSPSRAAMGICFSKKTRNNEKSPPAATLGHPPPPSKSIPRRRKVAAAAPPLAQDLQVQAAVFPGKKQIFITVPNKEKKAQLKAPDKPAATAGAVGVVAASPAMAADKKKSSARAATLINKNGLASPQDEDAVTASTVRTSSCTKEEVESILIQCGRLSRNSSAVEDEYRRSRKRSYDFDCADRSVEEDREKPQLNRASPQRHRRTPSRDRDSGEPKRSGSRERGSGGNGGRRVSRSPARRSDSAVASSSSQASSALEKTKQAPGRMVAVPAREKPSVPSEAGGGGTGGARKATPPFSAADGGNKRGGDIRSASPRSRSPANPSRPYNENTHSLSRSSSRKAEQSPCKRNPMSEVDGNIVLKVEQLPSLKANQSAPEDKGKAYGSRKSEEGPKRSGPHSLPQRNGENSALLHRNAIVEVTNVENGSRCVKEQVLSGMGKEQQPQGSEVRDEMARMILKGGEILFSSGGAAGSAQEPQPSTRVAVSRGRSSRRSSKDLDANPDALLNHTSYASMLLEDIHNYQQQTAAAAPAFSLPACVSKACSILEAVADLNSSCGGSKFSETDPPRADEVYHYHQQLVRTSKTRPAHDDFVEAEEAEKDDDLMKPSLHKYVSDARGFGVKDLEPQESAGSNSFVGPTWASEPSYSVDSADRSWTSARPHNDGLEGLGGELGPPEAQRKQPHHYHKQPSETRERRVRSSGGAAINPDQNASAATNAFGKRSA